MGVLIGAIDPSAPTPRDLGITWTCDHRDAAGTLFDGFIDGRCMRQTGYQRTAYDVARTDAGRRGWLITAERVLCPAHSGKKAQQEGNHAA